MLGKLFDMLFNIKISKIIFLKFLFLGMTAPIFLTSVEAKITSRQFNFPDGQYQLEIEYSFEVPEEKKPQVAIRWNKIGDNEESSEIKLFPTFSKKGNKFIPKALYAKNWEMINQLVDDIFQKLLLANQLEAADWPLEWRQGSDYPRLLANVWDEKEFNMLKKFAMLSEKEILALSLEAPHFLKNSDSSDILNLESLQNSPNILLVTHASEVFDPEGTVKPALDHMIDLFQGQNFPIIFLVSNDDLFDFSWLSEERRADLIVQTGNGDHNLNLKTPVLTLSGGYYSLCLNRTLSKVVRSLRQKKIAQLTLQLPLAAIYEDKYFFPVEHLKGQARQLADEYKFSGKTPMQLNQVLKTFGAQSLLNATITLLQDALEISDLEIDIKIDKKSYFTRKAKGYKKNKKKLFINMISGDLPNLN